MTPERLPREIAPPSTLEDQTVGLLRSHGLLTPPRRVSGRWKQAAAAVVLFAAGAAAGIAWDAPTPIAPGQPRFLLLLEGAPLTTTPEEARVVADYRNWATRQQRAGCPGRARRVRAVAQRARAWLPGLQVGAERR